MLQTLRRVSSSQEPALQIDFAGHTFVQRLNRSGKTTLLAAIAFMLGGQRSGITAAARLLPPEAAGWLLLSYRVKRQARLIMVWRENLHLKLGLAATGYEAGMFEHPDGSPLTPEQVWAQFKEQKLSFYPEFDHYTEWQDALWGTGKKLKAKDRARFRLSAAPIDLALCELPFTPQADPLASLKSVLQHQTSPEGFTLDLAALRQTLWQSFQTSRAINQLATQTDAWESLQQQAHTQRQAAYLWTAKLSEQKNWRTRIPQEVAALQAQLAQLTAEKIAADDDLTRQTRQTNGQIQQTAARLGWLQHQAQVAFLADAVPDGTEILAQHQLWQSWHTAREQLTAQWQAEESQALETLQLAQQTLHQQLVSSGGEHSSEKHGMLSHEEAQKNLTTAIEQRVECETQLKGYQLRSKQRSQELAAEMTRLQVDQEHALMGVSSTIDALSKQIEDSAHSLYGWLENRYPGWRETFGKAIREDLLYLPYLSPEIDRINDLIFGVHIDWEELDLPLRDRSVLETERKQAEAKREQLAADFMTRKLELEKKILNHEKRSKQQNRSLRKAIEKAKYAENQCIGQLSRSIQGQLTQYQRQISQMAATQVKMAYAGADAVQIMNDFLQQSSQRQAHFQAQIHQLSFPQLVEGEQHISYPEAEINLLHTQLSQLEAKRRQQQQAHEQAQAKRARGILDLQIKIEAWQTLTHQLPQDDTSELASEFPGDALPAWTEWYDEARHIQQQYTDATWALNQQLQAFSAQWEPTALAPWPQIVTGGTDFEEWQTVLEEPLLVWQEKIQLQFAQQAKKSLQQIQGVSQRFHQWSQVVRGWQLVFNAQLEAQESGYQLLIHCTWHPVAKALAALHTYTSQPGFLADGLSLFSTTSEVAPEYQLVDLIRELTNACMNTPQDSLPAADLLHLEAEGVEQLHPSDQALHGLLALHHLGAGANLPPIWCLDDWDRWDPVRQATWYQRCAAAQIQLITAGLHPGAADKVVVQSLVPEATSMA